MDTKHKQVLVAAGVLVERLPQANDTNVEVAIENLQRVERKRLLTYFDEVFNSSRSTVSKEKDQEALDGIVSDCLLTMEKDSLRWIKEVTFQCTCSQRKVWSALKLLPKNDILDILVAKQGVQVSHSYNQTLLF